MKRNEFFKECGAGICGCGVLGLLAPMAARAGDTAVTAAAAHVDPELQKQQLTGSSMLEVHSSCWEILSPTTPTHLILFN
jgi:hypothetical protein